MGNINYDQSFYRIDFHDDETKNFFEFATNKDPKLIIT